MQRSTRTAYRAFLSMPVPVPVETILRVAAPRPAPYQRCTCGSCRKCRENERWDRIFAKFEVKESDVRGVYQCALNDFCEGESAAGTAPGARGD